MKLKMQLVLLALLGLFCIAPIKNIDPVFQPYLDSFVKLTSGPCGDKVLNLPPKISIDFIEKIDNPNIIAYCKRSKFWWSIRILRSDWDRELPNEKFETIYHELSHCILYADHSENPYNYMYYSLVGLPEDMIKDQVLEDVWKLCGQK